MAASRVVLTDVSVKMLDICRRRLAGMTSLRAEALAFATFSGTEDCFRPDAFDTCYGTAVLHHILDVRRLLGQIHRLLQPGGRAFFMEPNLRFHRALTATLAAILADWAHDGTLPREDAIPMVCWMAEVHCNAVNSGELDVLADREDKHLFVAEMFEAMADAAGFGMAAALPCGPDPTGENTIKVYMGQCGISSATTARLLKAWPAAQRAWFGPLEPRDQSPSYLLWLAKSPR
nr:methyltransferase [uncultured Rhodopila sp.]